MLGLVDRSPGWNALNCFDGVGMKVSVACCTRWTTRSLGVLSTLEGGYFGLRDCLEYIRFDYCLRYAIKSFATYLLESID
jgi:hypothetical protein